MKLKAVFKNSPFLHSGAMTLALILVTMVSTVTAAHAKCQRIDFEHIMLEKMYDGRWELTVSGETPRINMDVELKPRYHGKRPNFWQIEVVGCYPGLIGLPIPGRFNTSIPLDDSIGHKGVVLIGQTYFQKKRF